MTRNQSKRLQAMRANPAGWRIEDVEAVCREHDIYCRAPHGGGSHFRIAHPRLAEKLTTPSKRPIKPVYIRALVAFIDAVRGLA